MEIDLKDKKPDIRYLKDIERVVFDKEWYKTADPDLELYYMYRGIKEENGLRYDITVIPALMLGKEFNKTKGHFHIGNFKETYTVLEGQALFLMQNNNDIYAVKAKEGESIIIPSGYGHVTINPSDKDLKMANWICLECKNDYSLYEEKNGAGYYYTSSGLVKNPNYSFKELRFEEPLAALPENLEFLK